MNIFKPIVFVITVLSIQCNASLINLDFSNQIEVNNATSAFGLGPAHTGNTMHYINVGTDDGITADARVTATPFGIYSFDYHIPNYNQTSGAEPNGDIGFIMTSNSVGTGGLTYLFELFDGTGANSNTFTTPLEAELLSIMIYDVDGESSQSETFRAYFSDGFYSYQTGTDPSSLVATLDGPDEMVFTGPGTNYSEQSTTGAAILNFRNTSSFTLNFESETYSSSGPNPVFSAIDGDLSMGSDDFNPPVSVSEPKFIFIFMIFAALLLCAQPKRIDNP
jgi:hypothetical protein